MRTHCLVLLSMLILLTGVQPAGAIINGAVDSDHPAVGAVTDGYALVGSGVLIAPHWVLTSATTAAACAGGEFLLGQDFASAEANHSLSGIFPHPDHDPDTGANDIALLRLTGAEVDIAPLPFNDGGLLYPGDPLLFVGFGATTVSDDGNTLRRYCYQDLAEVYQQIYLSDWEGAGPYTGDEGGPALASLGGVQQVVGIVSGFGEGGNQATITTRVDVHASFITATMAAHEPTAVGQDLPLSGQTLTAAPNPFNPVTEITFQVDQPADCELSVYDARGRLVDRLARGRFGTGTHTVRWDARRATSGVYLVRLRTGREHGTLKVVLVR